MWSHLLIHIIQEGGKEVPYFGEPDGAGWLGEALLYALLGFFVTFLGIVLLIFIVWLCGQIVSRLSARCCGPACERHLRDHRPGDLRHASAHGHFLPSVYPA